MNTFDYAQEAQEAQELKRIKLVNYAIDNKLTIFKENNDILLILSEVQDKIKELKININTVMIEQFTDNIKGVRMISLVFLGYHFQKLKEHESYYYKSLPEL